MKKKDLLKLVESATDEQDIDSLLENSELAKTLQSSGLTLEAFKEKLKTDKAFKAYVESENDKYFNKALDTWKKNNLEKEIDPFVKEKYPELVTDPTQKKLLELEAELEKERKANARKDLLAEAIKYANEKGIKLKAIDKFLGEDIGSTKANLDSLAEDWSKGLESLVDEKMKSSSYVPGGNNLDGSKMSIGEAIAAKLNQSQSTPSDPWATK